jgi:hypothetical protein
MSWVWRDTPDAETTHTLCHAQSADLANWRTLEGETLELPITYGGVKPIDPVGPNGGLINGNHPVGFDAAGRVVVSYQKHDRDGNTQIFQARGADGRWTFHRSTDWPYRWDFAGTGSLEFALSFGPLHADRNGRILQDFRHSAFGAGTLVLDAETLAVTGVTETSVTVPESMWEPVSGIRGAVVNFAVGSGEADDADRCLLRWESLPENRDRARKGRSPEPSELTVSRITAGHIGAEAEKDRRPFEWRNSAAAVKQGDGRRESPFARMRKLVRRLSRRMLR